MTPTLNILPAHTSQAARQQPRSYSRTNAALAHTSVKQQGAEPFQTRLAGCLGREQKGRACRSLMDPLSAQIPYGSLESPGCAMDLVPSTGRGVSGGLGITNCGQQGGNGRML